MIYYDAQAVTSQVVFSSIVVWLLSIIKKSNLTIFSWVNENSYALNKIIAIIASGIVALGMSWTYSYTKDGVFTLMITGLTVDGIYNGAKQWIFSYIVQQTGYRITKPAETEK